MTIIAVTSDNKFIDIYDWHAAPRSYTDAIMKHAGAIPLIIPSLPNEDDIDEILHHVDGVLLTGARSNVHPAHYGEESTEDHEPHDHERDATTLPLARKALERGIPLLAICRGIQELNVALGGTLSTEIQREKGRMDHRGADNVPTDIRFEITHDIQIKQGSRLAEILGADKVPVNSLHRQAIRIAATNLAIEATASDGTIEAVSVIGAKNFAIGVQWHPEYWVNTDTPSARIFAAFGMAAKKYAKDKTTMGKSNKAEVEELFA